MSATGSRQTNPVSRINPSSMLLSFKPAGDDCGLILRTRSLDEADSPSKSRADGLGQDSDHTDHDKTKSALHASFDTSLLRTSNCASLFGYDDRRDAINVWDEGDISLGDISGKKHLRPSGGHETIESRPPGAVRKLAKRTCAEPNSKTPGRPPPGSLKKPSSSTPSSAVKRRRAPLPQRLSPMRRVLVPPTPGAHVQPATNATSIARKIEHDAFENPLAGTSCLSSPQALTPTRPYGLASKTKFSKWHNTGTTAGSTLLETPLETDSVDTTSPATTRFRFTSFPASLPRVNNPRNRNCPDSVRKRMSFGDAVALDESNQSRDDDGTHNTSISSLSADGHTHLPLPPGKHALGTGLRDPGGDGYEEGPVHTQLFSDEDFGYSDDDTVQSPAREAVGRTRLNFNTVLSPNMNELGPNEKKNLGPAPMELSRSYEHGRINSFQSSLSSNSIQREEAADTLTPARHSNKPGPQTPHEVQLTFPLEAECSPIPGVREDTVDCGFGCVKGPELSPGLLGDSLLSNDRPPSGASRSFPKNSKSKEAGSIGSDSTNEKARRLRPMPDISAFESVAVSSRGERSTDDSVTLDSKGMPSSQRYLCPPTPVRTPAWANENGAHAFFGRQNSLITTKVLLSCPSQVLVGRCSLESSVLDDSTGQNTQRTSTSNTKKQAGGIALKHPEKKQSLHNVGDATSHITQDPIIAPPKLTRRVPSPQEVGSVISFSNDFEVLGVLGSGAFADVYKARSIRDNRLYAVKRNRRQFRGKRDRDMALAEVQCMQRLQSTCVTEPQQATNIDSTEKSSYSLYLLFFYNAWQEDGYFFCQTELCCRDTCRELLDSLRFLWNSSKRKYPSLMRNLPAPAGIEADGDSDVSGRSVPISTIWKICHDIVAGLSHIHSHGVVHNDIKPSNIFFVDHPRFGAMCKIGDFGISGDIGSSGDGQEGDARYMPPELLKSGTKHPSADVFSLGLTLFEIASDKGIDIPSEGPRWHELRSEGGLQLPNLREHELANLIKQMTSPEAKQRQTADAILRIPKVKAAGHACDEFLRDYLRDIEEFDRLEDERLAKEHHDEQTPRNGSHRSTVAISSPSLSMMLPAGPSLLSPLARPFY